MNQTPILKIDNGIKAARNLIPSESPEKMRAALETAISATAMIPDGWIVRSLLEEAASCPGDVMQILDKAESVMEETRPLFKPGKVKFGYR